MGRKHMCGVYVVEFAIVGLLLFVLLFGVLEMGRLYFTVNAMSEVVRRGARLAAVCDPTKDSEQQAVLRRALLNAATDADASSLISGLQVSSLDLIYLDEDGKEIVVPNSVVTTEQFRAIRFVRLRVDGFPFNLLIPGFDGAITLPTFQATLPRESLGRHAESDVNPITPC